MKRRAWREMMKDTAGLALAGVALGLLVNALSPRGISLTRDYFPRPPHAVETPRLTAAATTASASAPPVGGMSEVRRLRLAQLGVEVISHARAAQLFHDPAMAEGRIAFVDARDDSHFQSGHIRGAIQFDHYRMENYLSNVLTACTVAEQIVVYCTGGECEDSELAINDLVQFGIPVAKLKLYAGGFAEWESNGMPSSPTHALQP